MKNTIYIASLLVLLIISCNTSKSTTPSSGEALTFKNDTIRISNDSVRITNDTIRIANDELQYEVIIIDPGFSTWLVSRAYPRGYHSQSYLETKNIFYVTEWNNRVMQPQRYDPNLYEMTINYNSNIDYGYEVNYLIYNYMIYFQNTYKQNLYGYVPMR